jgi:UDP-N-acetylglucosamine 2-epimerase (non-hydrolysing)
VKPHHVVVVVGARPNFMKAAPILAALEKFPALKVTLVHTGQHYSPELSDVFFRELDIRAPDVSLEVGSGSHGRQTARILERFEDFLVERREQGDSPRRVVVAGDVNSTLACALAAAKLGVPVAHVEAGLRSFDRTMPEEINRVVTDAISDLLLVSEPAGVENLKREGIAPERIHLVGNVMIDTLRRQLERARRLETLDELGVRPSGYGVVTLHRPSNVDDTGTLRRILETLAEISRRVRLLFAVHPRTAARLDDAGLTSLLNDSLGLKCLPPLPYVPFLCLTSQAMFVISDSGGLQEESTALGIPCLTLRENTERPVTVTEGTSTLVGGDMDLLRRLVTDVLEGRYKTGKCPASWDGRAAERIAEILVRAT